MAIMAVAEELKKRNPNRIIVLGGPHLNITHNNLGWFIKHKFVDAICEPTSYGEWFITDIINQYAEGDIDWKEVSFAIYKTGRGKTPNKIDFDFPAGIISGNEDILFECKNIAMDRNVPLVLPIELTRGCPYECVFCEWGGGIGGKVIRKPLDMIKEDLDWIQQIGIEQIQILDANYGIYLEDEDVSKYIETIKGYSGLPNHVEIYGMTKSKQERRWATIEPLARAKVVERYKLSLQTLNNEVLKNIKRTDIPREKDFEFAQYLFDTYGIRSDFEFMMGLPGYTRDDFYDEVDIQYEYGYNLERYLWLFLPDSPAYSPDYIKEHNIKTEKICIGKSRMNSYSFDDVSTFGDYHISADPKYTSDVEFVVEANGFTRKDFTEFFFMNYWILENVSLIRFTDSIVKHNIENGRLEKPSLIFRKIYEKIVSPSENKYVMAMNNLNEQMYDLMAGNRKEVVDYKQFNLPFTDVSVDFSYIYKSCVYVFEKDYIEFLCSVGQELNLEIPEDIINQFTESLNKYRESISPKYDKSYQIRTYYENFINERYRETA
jgi:tRNA A37 methylthiotransferase MiaB